MFHALVYIYMTLSFTNIDIMFRSCLYTPTSMLLKFVQTQKLFYKSFLVRKILFFPVSGWPADRPVDRRQCQDVHVCARLSVDSPGRPTVSRSALGLFGSTARSTALRKLCFLWRKRSTERSTGAQRLFANKANGRPAGRPLRLQEPNGSFLFGAILKTVFIFCFNRLFESCWRSFSGQIRCKENGFNLFSPYK